MNKAKENIVVIFAKQPIPGHVKTRIAEETSVQFAYEFAKTCLADLVNRIGHSDYYDIVVATDTKEDVAWFQKNFSINGFVVEPSDTQSGKFHNVFSELLCRCGYKKAVLVPMDIPFISAEDIISSFAWMDKKDFVLGPEVNGGIYLIGVKGPYDSSIFEGVRWSTPTSFDDLKANCGQDESYILKLKNDLNLPNDIISLKDDIYQNCPMLYDFLKKNGFYFGAQNSYVNFDDLSISIPVVSVIIEKGDEILIQTRYKPTIDPKYTGTIEIPSGLIKKYELAQEAAVREVEEETGAIVEIVPNELPLNDGSMEDERGDVVAVYNPHYCAQQLYGGRSYMAIAFLAKYIGGNLRENVEETRNIHWIKKEDLKKKIEEDPSAFFSLILPILKAHLGMK